MALKDLLSLIDDSLQKTFHTKPHDPAKGREQMLKRIAKTREQFAATEPARGSKDFALGNGAVRYSPTLGREKPVSIGGKSEMYIPSERFDDFLDKLEAAVKAGELDDAIKSAMEDDQTTTAAKPARQRRAPSTGGGSREWTPERRAKYAASIAARNAAKA